MEKIGKDLEYARKLLIKGALVAIPTETVYGLAANGLNADAVLRIYEVKNRPSFNPLILHTASIEKAKGFVDEFPEMAQHLAAQFWPGPLTLVLKKKNIVPDLATAGLDTVGIRVPRHPLTLRLLDSLDFPLAAPSANPSGYVSPTTPQHVAAQLGNKCDYILDGGKCEVGIESTIVKVTDNEVIVLRLGGIEPEKIKAALSDFTGASIRLQHTPEQGSRPESPGMMTVHYAPRKKILLGDIEKNIMKCSGKKIGMLFFKKEGHPLALVPGEDRHKQMLAPGVPGSAVVKCKLILSPSGNLHEAARNLFSYLRQLDESDIELILAEPAPEEGLGRAINDRLRRASAG